LLPSRIRTSTVREQTHTAAQGEPHRVRAAVFRRTSHETDGSHLEDPASDDQAAFVRPKTIVIAITVR
jgi:hypothetical protein